MSFGFTTTTATTCCRHLWRGGRGVVPNAFFLFNYRLSSKCLVAPLRQYHRHSNDDDDDDDFEMVDTLIIGGGPMGSSTAYHLAQLQQQQQQQQQHSNNPNHRNIVVLEQDPTYQSCSATVSAGGIRQHFSLEENVRMSMYGRDFLRNAATLLKVNNNTTTGIDDNTNNTNNSSSSSKSSTTTTVDVQFQERGYLFLATTKDGKRNMLDSNAVQRRAGCTTTKLMSAEALKLQFPWLNTDDILLGSFGTSGEGWFDPWAYLKGLKEKNQQDLGVTYLTGKPVSAKRETNNYYGDGRIVSVDILQRHHQQQGSSSSSSSTSSPKLRRLHVNNVVNAAGAYAKRVMDLLAGDKYPLEYPIPVMPRKRCIFYFNCSTRSTSKIIPDIAPLTVDSSNVYFRSEGKPGNGNFICGVSPSCDRDVDFMCDDDDGTDHSTTSSSRILAVTSDDYETLFEDCIWPSIAHRVPAFESIKVLSQWAGLYEYNTVDQNAIIDRHPEMNNVVMVNGFSGHGLQQSPAAGRAAAELLYYNDNEFRSLDLNVFRFDRCMEGRPVLERGIV